MISPQALRDAAAEKIKKISQAKVYENTVLENFKAPCFFVEIPSFDVSLLKRHDVEVKTTVQLTYFPPIETGERVRSDKSTLRMMEKISLEFCRFEVGDRVLTPAEGVHFSFLGENTDILQVSISLDFYDCIFGGEEEQTIEEVNFS